MVVDIIKVFSPSISRARGLKAPPPMAMMTAFRLMYLTRSSDSEEVALFFLNILYSFIEEDRCIESFDLLDQAVAQFFTS